MKYIKVMIYMSLLFFVGVLSVRANESYDYTFTGVEMWGNDVGGTNTALINLIDSDGNVLNTYCIDYNTSTASEHNYSVVNVGDASYIDDDTANIISNIVKNAYPFSTLEKIKNISGIDTLTEEEVIASAQAAIWHYANEKDFELENNVKLLYDYYLTLDNSITTSTDISELDIIFNTYFEEGIRNTLIEINSENVYDLEYSFDKDLKLEYGFTLEEVDNGILIRNIPVDAEFGINVNAKQDINDNVYFFYPEGGHSASQSLVGVSSGTINVSNSGKIKIQDNYYSVTINKMNSVTGKSIPNVKFKISNTSDFSEYVMDATTNEEGIIIFDEIPNGTWYIKEVEAPLGYISNEDITKIEVNNKDVNVDIFNDPYAKIKIIKENELGEKLDGVFFDLYKDGVSENKLIRKDIVTDINGEAIIENLDKGKYILGETKTKEAHILNVTQTVVNVDYGETIDVTIINETIGTGNLIIRKIDSGSNNLLKGARIGIYKDEKCNDLYMEIETSDEEYTINDIPSGKYCVKEIEAPSGYILNLDSYFVEIVKNETASLEIGNNKIYKTALNHHIIFAGGIISLIVFVILYIGYNLCSKKV